MYHAATTIENINDKQELLNVLSTFSDEDFNGNNGKEYLWDFAQGYESNQDYVLDTLEKSDLTGEELVHAYFNTWFDNDGYYRDYNVIVAGFKDDKAVISIVYETDV